LGAFVSRIKYMPGSILGINIVPSVIVV
jgi:hypothetical protein